jgi:hypothetical protein
VLHVAAGIHEKIALYIEIMKAQPTQLTDDALLAEVKRLAQCEREITATLVAHLVEVEARDLYRAEGCSSMFTYCTDVLRFSEDAACMRLQAARAVRAHPAILAELASGALHLSSLRYLVRHLTAANRDELIAASRHKSKREVEKLVREQYPLPDVPSSVRKLPMQRPAAVILETSQPMPVRDDRVHEDAVAEIPPTRVARPSDPVQHPSVIAPLAAERYKVQFTANASLHDKLRRAQDLLRHRIPTGDVAQVMELALAALVEKLEKQRLAATERPRASRGVTPGSRAIPSAVKRAVWVRDGGRCAFIGNGNRRCRETGFLEFHHVVPYARGGEATVTNIALRCRSHNQYEAKLEFGPFDPSTVRESSAPWGMAARESSAPGGMAARESGTAQATTGRKALSDLRSEGLEAGIETRGDVFPSESAIT